MPDRLSQVFAALADPTRRDMVARLCAGDATVGELAAPYDVSLQAVSKHLKVLEGAGLVTRGRRRAAAAGAPRGGGVRPDDQVDRALPPRGRGPLPAPGRRPGGAARRPGTAATRTTPTDPARSRPTHDHRPPRRPRHHHDRGAGRRAPDPDDPRVRRPRPPSCSAPTPRPSCSRGGPARDGTRCGSTSGTPAPAGAGATSPSSTASRYGFHGCFHTVREDRHRPDLHLRGHARRRRPRDDVPSRTSATAARGWSPSRWSTASRAATRCSPRAWRSVSTTGTRGSTPCSRPARSEPRGRPPRRLMTGRRRPVSSLPMQKTERTALVAVLVAIVALIGTAAVGPRRDRAAGLGRDAGERHQRRVDVGPLAGSGHATLERRRPPHAVRPGAPAAPTAPATAGSAGRDPAGRRRPASSATGGSWSPTTAPPSTGALGVLGETSPDQMAPARACGRPRRSRGGSSRSRSSSS